MIFVILGGIPYRKNVQSKGTNNQVFAYYQCGHKHTHTPDTQGRLPVCGSLIQTEPILNTEVCPKWPKHTFQGMDGPKGSECWWWPLPRNGENRTTRINVETFDWKVTYKRYMKPETPGTAVLILLVWSEYFWSKKKQEKTSEWFIGFLSEPVGYDVIISTLRDDFQAFCAS